jgi:hypothetical protein
MKGIYFMTKMFEAFGLSFDLNIPIKYDDWLVVKNEKYRPDRNVFIYEAFKKAFPQIKVADASMVYKLASRSVKLNEWVAKVNVEYALIQNEPTFYRDYVSPKDYEIVMRDLITSSERNKKRAAEELLAAQQYKAQLEDIDKRYSGFEYNSKYSRIINLSSNRLPLSYQLAIENYVPTVSGSQIEVHKKAYAREVLVSYKIQLIKILKSKPDVDIDKVINDLQEK